MVETRSRVVDLASGGLATSFAWRVMTIASCAGVDALECNILIFLCSIAGSITFSWARHERILVVWLTISYTRRLQEGRRCSYCVSSVSSASMSSNIKSRTRPVFPMLIYLGYNTHKTMEGSVRYFNLRSTSMKADIFAVWQTASDIRLLRKTYSSRFCCYRPLFPASCERNVPYELRETFMCVILKRTWLDDIHARLCRST